MSSAGVRHSFERSVRESFEDSLLNSGSRGLNSVHDSHSDEFDDELVDDQEIEREFQSLFDVKALNSRYNKFKEELTVIDDELNEEEEELIADDDEQLAQEIEPEPEPAPEEDSEEINDIKDTEYEDDLVELEEQDEPAMQSTAEKIIKVIFKVILKVKHNFVKVLIAVMLLTSLIAAFIYINDNFIGNNNEKHNIIDINSFSDIKKSINNLQFQINDNNERQTSKLHDFKNYIDVKFDKISKKFYSIDEDLNNLSKNNDILIRRIEELKLSKINIKNEKIPVILDANNNVKILPEFESYLINLFENEISLSENMKKEFEIDYKRFLSDYLDEILNKKVGFMKKEEILSLISFKFQENKSKLISEIKSLINSGTPTPTPPHFKDLKYNKTNEKINYSLASNGARIINYLTSKTFKPKYKKSIKNWFGLGLNSNKHGEKEIDEDVTVSNSVISSPFIVLTEEEGFWKSSDVNGTRLAIKFLEPIFISDVFYKHKKLLNGAILTSAPKKFSVFVNSVDNKNEEIFKQSKFNERLNGYIKVGEFEYNLNSETIEQSFDLPPFTKKYLINSIIFKVDSNYGNDFFTSLYKFRINGLTKFDIYSLKQFLTNDVINDEFKQEIGSMIKSDYAFSNNKNYNYYTENQSSGDGNDMNNISKDNDPAVPELDNSFITSNGEQYKKFGQDEVIDIKTYNE